MFLIQDNQRRTIVFRRRTKKLGHLRYSEAHGSWQVLHESGFFTHIVLNKFSCAGDGSIPSHNLTFECVRGGRGQWTGPAGRRIVYRGALWLNVYKGISDDDTEWEWVDLGLLDWIPDDAADDADVQWSIASKAGYMPPVMGDLPCSGWEMVDCPATRSSERPSEEELEGSRLVRLRYGNGPEAPHCCLLALSLPGWRLRAALQGARLGSH